MVRKRAQWWPAGPDLPGIGLALAIGLAAVLVRVLPPSPLVSDVLLALVLGALLAVKKFEVGIRG